MNTLSKNEPKLQNFLEENIILYNNGMDRKECSIIMDRIFEYEKRNALKKCKDLDKSMGFSYFIDNYKNHELCLEFFASRMVENILWFKEDTESLIHDKYNSYSEFINDKPNDFLINVISKHDKDLARYTKANLSEESTLESIKRFNLLLNSNWQGYKDDKLRFDTLIAKLDSCFELYGGQSICAESEIIIYLFSKHGMLDKFIRFYKMEDTNPEDAETLIKESDVCSRITNIRDIELISAMNRIIQNDKVNNYLLYGKELNLKMD